MQRGGTLGPLAALDHSLARSLAFLLRGGFPWAQPSLQKLFWSVLAALWVALGVWWWQGGQSTVHNFSPRTIKLSCLLGFLLAGLLASGPHSCRVTRARRLEEWNSLCVVPALSGHCVVVCNFAYQHAIKALIHCPPANFAVLCWLHPTSRDWGCKPHISRASSQAAALWILVHYIVIMKTRID